ncbi:MAG TPA: helix-turn-helix transcriptional regulator [Asticcacaulis sp.]|nr:helix-turn-helix transcriptional regulator [Asticcacaulis sp.]
MRKYSEVADKTINPVDLHVGSKVRLRRKFLGKSQQQLADAIDLTFQQVQKYERGVNRISASKLYEIAQFLQIPLTYFFEGFGEGERTSGASESEYAVQSFLATSEGIELAEAFPRIRVPKQRRKILELVRSLADLDS